MAKKTIAELEEQVARARLALAEAKKTKKKIKEEDDDADQGDHSDEVDVKKGSDKDSDEDDKVDEDAEGEFALSAGKGKEPDVKDHEGDAATWGKKKDVAVSEDADEDEEDKIDGEDEEDKEKADKEVKEDAEEDAEKADKDGDDEGDKELKDAEKDAKNEAKKHKKRLHTLLQSYREEDQPPVENGPDPLLGGKRPDAEKSVAEGVAVLFDGENLTEGFKKKASTLVEAAVNSRVNAEVKLIEAAAEKALVEAVSEIEEELMSKTDDYIGYVVTEWLEENKLEAEQALKVEIFEGFFDGLKALFLEHNITMPEGKLDILRSANSEIEELEGIVNTMTEKLIKADKTILEMKKQDVVSGLSEGLAATQVEKLKKLTEGIEAKDIESFKEKVSIIRESYFKDNKLAPKKDSAGAKVYTEANADAQVLKYLNAAKADNE